MAATQMVNPMATAPVLMATRVVLTAMAVEEDMAGEDHTVAAAVVTRCQISVQV
jgi:hypothetical protein